MKREHPLKLPLKRRKMSANKSIKFVWSDEETLTFLKHKTNINSPHVFLHCFPLFEVWLVPFNFFLRPLVWQNYCTNSRITVVFRNAHEFGYNFNCIWIETWLMFTMFMSTIRLFFFIKVIYMRHVSVIVSFRDVKPDNILLDEQGKGVNSFCVYVYVCVCCRHGLNNTQHLL